MLRENLPLVVVLALQRTRMRTKCLFSTDAYVCMYQKEEGTTPLSSIHAVPLAFLDTAYIYIVESGSASKKGICHTCPRGQVFESEACSA